MSLSGRRRRRDRSRLCEASNEASAIDTLIRQRPPTPSCRGLEPLLAERTVNPAGASRKSLTSNSRVREQPGPISNIARHPTRGQPPRHLHAEIHQTFSATQAFRQRSGRQLEVRQIRLANHGRVRDDQFEIERRWLIRPILRSNTACNGISCRVNPDQPVLAI